MFKEIKNKVLRIAVIVLYFVVLFFCALQFNFLWLFGYSPAKKDITSPTQSVASELYTADGKLIGRYYHENRTPVAYNEISKNVLNALIATEDVRFYKHNGVDFKSLISSGISTATGDKRGASTITQQLAKNLYRTRYNKRQGLVKYIPVVRTLISKFKEWLTAYKLEANYSKNELITMYLNTVSFGNNAYGLNTASRFYFDATPGELTVPQAAMLVGLLKGTTYYSPINHPERAKERRNVVINQMVKYNYLQPQVAKQYYNMPVALRQGIEITDANNSYLRTAVAKYLEKWAKKEGYDLYEDGLKIYTTINSKMQEYAEAAVKSQMKILQKRFYNVWGNKDPWFDSEGNPVNYPERAKQNLPVYGQLVKKYNGNADSVNAYFDRKKKMRVFTWNGARDTVMSTMDSIRYYGKILNTGMMTMDPFKGEILVWVGGIDHEFFKYDHVNQARRQAGSTFKPFVYLTALEQGMSPCDKFEDRPVKIKYQGKDGEDYWEPKNASGGFSYNDMTLRHALARSVNSITAQVTEKVGPEKVVEYAKACGITSRLNAVPSIGLGSNDVSVYEMTRAYGTFVANGVRTEPILVKRILDRDNNVIQEFTAASTQAISKAMAWLMTYMLRGGMEEPGGTSRALWEWDLFGKNNQIGGKTGTSSDYVDAWYMGITKNLVTGVWVGCDERTAHFKNGEDGEGSRTALPIFGKFMEMVYKDASLNYPQGPFPKSEEPITVTYDCPTPVYTRKAAEPDSVVTDSVANAADTATVMPRPNAEPAASQQVPGAAGATESDVVEELTGRERRQLKRKQRQEEKDKKREQEQNNP